MVDDLGDLDVAERRLVVATLNRAKGREIAARLAGLPYDVQLLLDLPGARLPEEGASSYRDNALEKARAAARQSGAPALGDDSGIEVDALGGGPGVLSARFGGPGLDDAGRGRHLLEALREVPDDRRSARFRCVIALVDARGNERTTEAVVEGVITREPRGTGGFGYDPVFFYPPLGRTFAELPDDEKARVSHRGLALTAARRLLSG